jgi:hypothetical protein
MKVHHIPSTQPYVSRVLLFTEATRMVLLGLIVYMFSQFHTNLHEINYEFKFINNVDAYDDEPEIFSIQSIGM